MVIVIHHITISPTHYSLAAPDPQKEGLGNLNTKKLTTAGMFAAPIKRATSNS